MQTIPFINRLVEKMFNYRKEELIGQPVEMLIPGRFRQEHIHQRTGFIEAPSARKMGKGRNLYAMAGDLK